MFYEALTFTLKNEGCYSGDPDDLGGETKWGISEKQYPHLDIENLTKTEVELIYLNDYWNPLYAKLNKKLGIRLFDLGVNIGVKRAVKIFQYTLNHYYKCNLTIDGMFGNQTLESCKSHPETSVYSTLIFEASKYYESLNQSKYFKGWLNRLYKNIG